MSKELFLAVKEGDLAKAIKALESSDCDVNIRGHSDITPIRLAVLRNRYEIAELLLKRKDINVDSTDDNTPLATACINKNIRMVKLLLPHSNLLIGDVSGEIPYQKIKRSLESAKTEDDRKTCQEIFELVRDATYLYAAKTGFLTGVTTMLHTEKANKNAIDHKGRSALMLATASGATSVVDELLKVRVDIDYVNPQTELSALASTSFIGTTTFNATAKARLLSSDVDIAQTEIAVKLIQAGANPNQMLTRPYRIPYVMKLLEDIKSDPGKTKYYEKIFQALVATGKLDLTVPYPQYRPQIVDGVTRMEFECNQNLEFLLKKIEPTPGKLHSILAPVYTKQIANTAPVVQSERSVNPREAQRFVQLAQPVQTESDARIVVQSMARSTGRTMEQMVEALHLAPATTHYLHNPMPTSTRMGTLPPPIAPQTSAQQQRPATTFQLPPPPVAAQPTPSAPAQTIRRQQTAAQLPPAQQQRSGYQAAPNVGPNGVPSMRDAYSPAGSNNTFYSSAPSSGTIPIPYTAQSFQTFQNVSPSRN